MADYGFIANTAVQPASSFDPLKQVTDFQRLQNMQTENALNQQQIGIRQSELGDSQRLGMAQQFSALASPSLIPDEQVIPIARTMLQTAINQGRAQPALARYYQDMIDKGDIGAIRQAAHIGMLGMLHGNEAISAINGTPVDVNTGQQIQFGMRGGPYSNNPGGFNQAGGTSGSVGLSSSPEFREGLEEVYVPGQGWVKKQRQQINTGPGATGQPGAGASGGSSSGAGSSSPNSSAGTGGGGTGNVNSGGSTGNPQVSQNSPPNLSRPDIGTEGDVNTNIAAYNTAQEAVAQHSRNVQGLAKAHDALEMVGTGKGTPQALSTLRAYAVGLMTSTGFQPAPGVNLQNASADILDKYLTDYARGAALGSGTNLDTVLAGKSNASGTINPLAARSVINTNIGRERMEIAAALAAKNPRTFLKDKAAFFNQYEPEGFAADMVTPEEMKSKVSKLSPDDQRKYNNSAEYAHGQKLLSMGRQNQFRGGVTQVPYPPSVSPQ